MKNYLRWCLRQLYLLLFLPTQFQREIDGDPHRRLGQRPRNTIRHIVKHLPWIIALAVLANLISGHICVALGIAFRWGYSWIGVATGVTAAVTAGVTIGVMSGVASGVAFGLAGGVAFGVVFGLAVGLAGDVAIGLAVGVAFGLAFGVALGLAFGVAGDVAGDVAVGVAFGLAVGLIVGPAVVVAARLTVAPAVGVAIGLAFTSSWMVIYFRLIAYPLEAGISAAVYMAGGEAERAWERCPVAWDEVIWLPLPFVTKLLVRLAQQDREEGFKQIAFVAAERKLQRRAALKALVEVAIHDLRAKSVEELAGVTERLTWTTDAPAELPIELATALARFDRAAQHTGQYIALHSAYRKSESLNLAIAEVEALQRRLIAVRGRYAPRVLQVANEWRMILHAERESLRALTNAGREIPNPFVFGAPVRETEHNVFSGRRDIAKQIEASILGAREAPTLLLHGPRRMGKTSILNQLARLLGPDFAPAVIDCQSPAVTESKAALLRYFSRSLSEGLQRKRVVVKPLNASALHREPFGVFDNWLDGAEQAMPERMRALLCLDEYERLQTALDAGWGRDVLDALRHLLQHRPKIVLMFTGAHTFQELGPAWTDRFISARRVRVSFLTRDEVQPLLTEPIPEFDMTYAPGALDSIWALTRGQPFLTQAVAFELVQFLNEQGRKQATSADVETAVTRALVSGGEYFANVWSDAGKEGQAILRAIARREPPPDFATARAWLCDHDVLNDASEIAVPMVLRWVTMHKVSDVPASHSCH